MADKVKTEMDIILEKQFERINHKLDIAIGVIKIMNDRLDQNHSKWVKRTLIGTANVPALEYKRED